MTKAPALALRVLYVSTAGRRMVKVEPKDGIITIEGSGAWKVDHNRIFPGKGAFDCICVQGQGEALPVWRETRLSAAETDSIANDNLLRQIKELAQGGKTDRINWIQLGVSLLLFLAIVGVGFKLDGDVGDIQKDLEQSHPSLQNQPNQGGSNTGQDTINAGNTGGGGT